MSKKLNAGAMRVRGLLLAVLLSFFQTTSLFAADKMTVAFASFGPALSPAWVTSDKDFWKDFWDLSLLDEIQRSGFVQRLYRK